jgi:hypothetical protein
MHAVHSFGLLIRRCSPGAAPPSLNWFKDI